MPAPSFLCIGWRSQELPALGGHASPRVPLACGQMLPGRGIMASTSAPVQGREGKSEGAPELYKTAIEFLKLEKIELGGVRGNLLGNLVTQIYDEVFELVKVFANCKYDPLDPGDSVGLRQGWMNWAPGEQNPPQCQLRGVVDVPEEWGGYQVIPTLGKP
ncbi:hypothetical protein P7K49_011941 [Saguinus oedipus]|uniref:Dynein heavy chain tail domain-containing protein n=1 Tax=Saguinus oedipus TaxID=9490 RepID=A0ABQ9VTM5_SAGOE|nr:hypothetical protein P7K49_011941 [Saguinus oedipus]